MYDKVLLPTDGSEGAEVSVQHAVDIADKYNAELHIIYVVDLGVETSLSSVSDLLSQLESSGKLEELGSDAVESIKKTAEDEGVETVTSIERGIPHKQINSYVEDNDIDMIVMGTHGRTGLDRMLLGSVTEKVLRSSDIPVLTVRRDN
ncbi:MAG: universal stress protein [Candidatus Nanohaloarchaea archaeon]